MGGQPACLLEQLSLSSWGPSVSLPASNFKGQRDKDIEATAVTKFIFSSFFHTGGRNYIALGKFKQLHEHYTGTGNGHNGLTILHSKINNHFFLPPKSCKNNEDVQSDVQTLRCYHVPPWDNDVSLYLGGQRHRGGMGEPPCRPGAGMGVQGIAQGCPSASLQQAVGPLLCVSSEMDEMASGSLRQSSCPSHSKRR